jgi:hypothetical protein
LERLVSEAPVPELVDSGDSIVDLHVADGEPESRDQQVILREIKEHSLLAADVETKLATVDNNVADPTSGSVLAE